jgi:hypothetical protein
MQRRKGVQTPQERVFTQVYARTSDVKYAAEKAGYRHPETVGPQTLARLPVQAEIARIQTERLFNELLPAAIDCLKSIIVNDKAPAGARVQAAKVVFDRTLGRDDALGGKEPHEMTGAELAAAIEKLESHAASKARQVEVVEVKPDLFG